MNHRKDRQLDRLIGHIENLTVLRPAALARLEQERRILDGYAAPSSEPRVSGGGSHSTPTEAAANARLQLDESKNYFNGLVDSIELAVKLTIEEANRILKQRTKGVVDPSVEAKPRCDGGVGREGALSWGRPDCTNVPGIGAICVACYHRERRYRLANDLPTRETA